MGADNYRRYLAGDQQGLVELIREYKDGLILYLTGLVGDIHTAEELTEDTFVKLGIKKPVYHEVKASFKTWLYAIAHNVALDHLRRQKRRAEVPLEEAGQIADLEQLERSVIREEDKIALYRALAKLKSEYREILWLLYFEQLDHKEASKIMKRSVRATQALASRARTALGEQLGKEGFVYEEL